MLDECKIQLGSNLLQQGPHGEQLSHGHAEGNILSSSGGEADLILELGRPQDGTATQGQHKPSPGLDRGWVLLIFVAMQSTEVGINLTVQSFIWLGDKLKTSFSCVQKVPYNALDCLAMGVSGTVAKASCLMDSKLDVWASVGGQVEEHSNSSWVGPLFSKWLAIFV